LSSSFEEIPPPTEASEAPAEIETSLLTKRYGSLLAVDNVTLNVKKGSVFGLMGPNGAGKTTMVKMFVGLERPTSGTGRIAGYDISKQSLEVRRVVGVLPDPIGFYDNLTAMQTLAFFSGLRGKGDFYTVADALNLVGLGQAASIKVGTFSRGMKQRLGLAQAIMHKPKILLLDEPTSGLDLIGMHVFHEMLKRFNKEIGVTIFLNTHNPLTVEETCDSLGIINKGKLLISGTLEEVRRQHGAESIEEIFLKVCPVVIEEVH